MITSSLENLQTLDYENSKEFILYMSNQDLQESDLEQIKDAILKFKKLESLEINLSYNNLDLDACFLLSQAITEGGLNLKNLYLNLKGVYFNRNDFKDLTSGISNCNFLTSLSFEFPQNYLFQMKIKVFRHSDVQILEFQTETQQALKIFLKWCKNQIIQKIYHFYLSTKLSKEQNQDIFPKQSLNAKIQNLFHLILKLLSQLIASYLTQFQIQIIQNTQILSHLNSERIRFSKIFKKLNRFATNLNNQLNQLQFCEKKIVSSQVYYIHQGYRYYQLKRLLDNFFAQKFIQNLKVQNKSEILKIYNYLFYSIDKMQLILFIQ
ncbi:hypothetical protein TTHERM_000238809 (macronuclear) [Tetrahymena thermophila SB210]|uniref:Uncharacterized protein n=1 Tax=Tetrahymena thermophila (strain SB210) TaxID=312017 RepID=W7X5Y6_TETTS|nr:hypothetical protein TTHERM_000238809 [Tetrahymena thermophila SB210]EWS71778.1 hypothetical protein TTHERM_000238809 [Tetrahymena thermophila SB210]|eukprot:XP_012655665.1 hypothetical protein TTHERM_000238809 [Tetrahymena thermophila SB210]